MLLNCGVGEDSWESLGMQGDQTSPSWRKSTLNIHWKDWCWSWSSNTLATWCRVDSFDKTLMLGNIEGRRRKWVTEDEMVGWHHQLNRHELSKLWEMVKDREAWRAVVHEDINNQKSQIWLSNQTSIIHLLSYTKHCWLMTVVNFQCIAHLTTFHPLQSFNLTRESCKSSFMVF